MTSREPVILACGCRPGTLDRCTLASGYWKAHTIAKKQGRYMEASRWLNEYTIHYRAGWEARRSSGRPA